MAQEKKRKIKLLINIAISFALIVDIFVIYLNSCSKADEEAIKALKTTENIKVEENVRYISFTPSKNETSSAMLIYPGTKIEAKAYAPISKELATLGYYVAIIKMPNYFPIFGINKANKVLKDTSYTNYFLAGHSLGGVMGSIHVANNVEKYKGLILLSAYSYADLSQTNLKALSIYGTEDKVLSKKGYEKYRSYLPLSTREFVIEGGCHSQYGNYGEQRNDGTPTISNSYFRELCVKGIDAFIKD